MVRLVLWAAAGLCARNDRCRTRMDSPLLLLLLVGNRVRVCCTCFPCMIMRRASIFSIDFSMGKKPLHRGLHTRALVGWPFANYSVCSQPTINIHVCPPHSSYTAPTPVPSGYVHAHILTQSSRAGIAATGSEIVELGAATCVF